MGFLSIKIKLTVPTDDVRAKADLSCFISCSINLLLGSLKCCALSGNWIVTLLTAWGSGVREMDGNCSKHL